MTPDDQRRDRRETVMLLIAVLAAIGFAILYGSSGGLERPLATADQGSVAPEK